MTTKIYALHGFLGLPSDWDLIKQGIRAPFEALALPSLSPPEKGLQNWARAFNHLVAAEPVQRRILLGYSQGGRLALHALLETPNLWSGAIIVSAHTGLKSPEERSQRLQTDAQWAHRFLNDPWEKLIGDWDRQTIFQGASCKTPVPQKIDDFGVNSQGRQADPYRADEATPGRVVEEVRGEPAPKGRFYGVLEFDNWLQGEKPFHRKQEDYDRATLATAIKEWSLGKQEDLQEPLSQLPFPILWVAGEKDHKYAHIAEQMALLHPHSSCWIAPGAGHRVPWECPPLFLTKINTWLQNLSTKKNRTFEEKSD